MQIPIKTAAMVLFVRILVVHIKVGAVFSLLSACLVSLASACALTRPCRPFDTTDRLLLIAHEVLSGDVSTGALLVVQQP